MPYIKSEPDEYASNPNQFMNQYNSQQNYGHFNQQNGGSVNPSDLSMGGGNFNPNYNFGGQNMSGSFNMGNSGFGEDELLESLGDLNDFSNTQQQQQQQHHNNHGMSMNQGQMNHIYSNTPDGAPIQSPFVSGFDYGQFRMNSIPQHMSPHQSSQFMNKHPSVTSNQRKSSADQRSPMTPRSGGMAALHIGTPESNSLQQNGQAIRAQSMSNRHQKSVSGQFDGTPGSLQSMHSYLDSPLSSPSNAMPHAR